MKRKREAEGVLGIDVNERSIDLTVVKPNKVKFIKIDISEAKYIRLETDTSGRGETFRIRLQLG
ncbi:MAG: hypothetical protein QXQ39_02880 [Conexivisphaerales archaeon]